MKRAVARRVVVGLADTALAGGRVRRDRLGRARRTLGRAQPPRAYGGGAVYRRPSKTVSARRLCRPVQPVGRPNRPVARATPVRAGTPVAQTVTVRRRDGARRGETTLKHRPPAPPCSTK